MTLAVTITIGFLLALAFAACWPLLGRLDNQLDDLDTGKAVESDNTVQWR